MMKSWLTMKFLPTLVAILFVWAPPAASAQTCSKQSPPHTLALVELYTSEGCDSCPPADKFVSGLKDTLAADKFVPLSLHVDYWDYIGWKDRFASAAFTERQRWQADLAHTRVVYTPEMFVAGRELRSMDGIKDRVAAINAKPAQAQIGITLGPVMNGKLPVDISAAAKTGGKLFVALYENSLVSEVKSGENHGKTLHHDYVVREWIGPLTLGTQMSTPTVAQVPALKFARSVNLPVGALAQNLGVAAFVQTDKGEVLQALALPLCGG
jgi:hypothetical protein